MNEKTRKLFNEIMTIINDNIGQNGEWYGEGTNDIIKLLEREEDKIK